MNLIMDILTLFRCHSNPDATFGYLLLSSDTGINLFTCVTLENTNFLIPLGEYKGSITFSPKFHRRLPFIDVPDRSGIRIHSGNYARNSRGCILVGSNARDGVLFNSTSTLNELLRHLPQEFSFFVTEDSLLFDDKIISFRRHGSDEGLKTEVQNMATTQKISSPKI